jgi:hypothetical protein
VKANTLAVDKLFLNIKEIQKDLLDYKRYIELQQSSKDMKFEKEVRACLNEQLTYINEL